MEAEIVRTGRIHCPSRRSSLQSHTDIERPSAKVTVRCYHQTAFAGKYQALWRKLPVPIIMLEMEETLQWFGQLENQQKQTEICQKERLMQSQPVQIIEVISSPQEGKQSLFSQWLECRYFQHPIWQRFVERVGRHWNRWRIGRP